MEFYIIGAVFIVVGLGLKALAARRRWIRVERQRRTAGDIVIIVLGVTIYLFSMILFLGLVSLLEAFGIGEFLAAWIAWFSTLFLVAVFCMGIGWKIGHGPTQRARMPDAFAEDANNPFGAPDRPASDLDFDRD
jgi:hypothetical protein